MAREVRQPLANIVNGEEQQPLASLLTAVRDKDEQLQRLQATLDRKAEEHSALTASYQSMLTQVEGLRAVVAARCGQPLQTRPRVPETPAADAAESPNGAPPSNALQQEREQATTGSEQNMSEESAEVIAAARSLPTVAERRAMAALGEALQQPLRALDEARMRVDGAVDDVVARVARSQDGLARSLSDVNAWSREALARLRT